MMSFEDSDLTESDIEALKEIVQRRIKLLKDVERIKEELKQTEEDLVNMERSKTIEKDRLRHGIKKFNNNPSLGIEILINVGIIKNTERSVAKFLYSTPTLSKTSIGIYLGEGKDFNKEVLYEFCQLHDFTGQNLDVALRKFLISFRLPGEAQKIDRMMETFATRYCKCNPKVFINQDTCFILSFAIIMMNTSLHNPSVKNKPNVNQFISMNRDLPEELPRELLVSLFEGIRLEPLKIPEEDDEQNKFFNPEFEGWLLKQGGRYKTWKKRWFVLTRNCLYYFEYPSDKEPKGIIPLQNLDVREIVDFRKMNCFEIYIPDSDYKYQTIKAAKTTGGKLHEGNHSTYIMSAPTLKERNEWMQIIRKCANVDPYYEVMQARKRNASVKSQSETKA